MKLDLVLENTRIKYTLGLLEESNLPEVETLRGKVMINESILTLRSLLVEEGTINAVKMNLEEAWTAALIQEEFELANPVEAVVNNAPTMINAAKEFAQPYVDQAQAIPGQVQAAVQPYVDQAQAGYNQASTTAGQATDAALKFANENKAGVAAAAVGTGFAGYGALRAGKNLAGAIRR